MERTVRYSVDPDGEIAVYLQVENQIRFAITSGLYRAGDLLPSVRDLAGMTGVNTNTVTKAYREMELRGIVRTRRGVGVRVAPNAVKLCKRDTIAMVKRHLSSAVAECRDCGMSRDEMVACLDKALAAGLPPYFNPLAAQPQPLVEAVG